MWTDLALADSNVLVHAFYEEAEHYLACRGLLERAQRGVVALCVAPQNLAEFYAVITNPRRVTKPRGAAEAAQAVARILAMLGISILQVPDDIVTRWLALVKRCPTTGPGIFDLQLAATMLACSVRRICTYNGADFRRFPEIEVLEP